MTSYDDIGRLVNTTTQDLREAHERATLTALRAIRDVVVAAYPAATGVQVSESDQGPWLQFDGIMVAAAPGGTVGWEELEGELPDALGVLASLIDDGEWRKAWLPVAHPAQGGWIIELDAIT